MLKRSRSVCFIVSFVLVMSVLVGCNISKSSESSSNITKVHKKSIVCSIFPEYDWVKEILGTLEEEYDVTLLLDSGVDLHSYQPTAEDIAKISTCDMFIYVGGESDGWAEDALKKVTNKQIQVVNLLEVLKDKVKEEELIEGMQQEEHHHHGHEEDGEHEEHEEHEEDGEHEEHEHHEEHGGVPEYDEHVWLSLKNAKTLVGTIKEGLKKIDVKNADVFEENYKVYTKKLDKLDLAYKEGVEQGSKSTLIFGDRFPFRYMVDDYGIDYYAAFKGCSAETEASFETIVFLANKVDELDLSYIMTIENAKHKIAETILKNTKHKNQKILELNSMQSITKKEVEAGISYLSIMESNLNVLKQALE